jgi:hypothetical protein
MPAITLSNVGSDFSNRACVEVCVDGLLATCTASVVMADIRVSLGPSVPNAPDSLF